VADISEVRVGVRDLKAHLSQYLAQVKQGTTIVVTEHGKAVGRLLPASAPLAQRLAAAEGAGLLAWSGQPLPRHVPVAQTRGSVTVADLLVADRE